MSISLISSVFPPPLSRLPVKKRPLPSEPCRGSYFLLSHLSTLNYTLLTLLSPSPAHLSTLYTRATLFPRPVPHFTCLLSSSLQSYRVLSTSLLSLFRSASHHHGYSSSGFPASLPYLAVFLLSSHPFPHLTCSSPVFSALSPSVSPRLPRPAPRCLISTCWRDEQVPHGRHNSHSLAASGVIKADCTHG